jgi:8-oxo-dGTP pyrophosphatase MutT (NUDIX family)
VETDLIAHSAGMKDGESRLTTGRSRAPIAKFFSPPKSSKLRGCEQVAAICYRIRGSGIEFLLIRTRGGRWTFPKGGIEPGLTHAQAAALEAFEEAGVHGRMEDDSFTHYVRHKRSDMRSSGTDDKIIVNAHLCEVLRLGPPQESNRDPTWFSVQKAKNRLRQDRNSDNGAQLAHVVDLAVARIQRFCSATRATDGPPKDALQKVQFDALEGAGAPGRMATAAFVQYIRGQRRDMRPSAAIKIAANPNRGKVLQLGPAQGINQHRATFSDENAKPRLETTFNSRKRPLDPTAE